MRKYVKPEITETIVKLIPLMGNSVTDVTGDVPGINTSDDEFPGGKADSRRRDVWDDEEEEYQY